MDSTSLVLGHIEGLLENVLSFLPINELLSKARVCRFWNEAVQRVIKIRSKKTMFNHVTFHVDEIVKYSKCVIEPHIEEERYGKRLKIKNHCIALESMTKSMLKWRNNLHYAPKIVILVSKSLGGTMNSCNMLASKICNMYQNYLPEDCIVVLLCGLLSDIDYKYVSYPMQIEALSFLSFPCDNINVMSWINFKTVKDKKSWLASTKTFISSQKDLKMLLFFYDISSRSAMSRWVGNQLTTFLNEYLKLYSNVVIVGCALNDPIHHSTNGSVSNFENTLGNTSNSQASNCENGTFFALAISGESWLCASVLANEQVNGVSELSSKLDLLKGSVNQDSQNAHSTFGVIISCVNRMHNTFWLKCSAGINEDVDFTVFQRKFPNLPVLSMYGFGEIGRNCNLLNQTEPEPENLQHSNSAVFAVVSFVKK